MNFTDTRSRTNDPDTSKEAAKNAATLRTMLLRSLLAQTIRKHDTHNNVPNGSHVIGWTAKELSASLCIDLPSVYRRLPECGGIKKSKNLRRQGCVVWISA
jgi:hypothetical protein